MESTVTEVCRIWHISHLHSIGFPEPHGGGARCAFVEDSDTVIL